jgi:hypothetical protein
MKTHKIVVVTPAGRRAYLDVLKQYIIRDQNIAEWHLWDNCRDIQDRAYIDSLEKEFGKIRIIRHASTDGSNRCINRFYATCTDPETFYIKMDDDIVYLEENTASSLLAAAIAEKESYLWWSPLVVNNALCSWLLQQHGLLDTDRELTAQASCPTGWKDPWFAAMLHTSFLDMLSRGQRVRVPKSTVSLSRYSINCIGFFGEDVVRYGPLFCPEHVSDEEWISAALPLQTGRYGRITGETCVAHYSFYTQEHVLGTTDILDRYYELAGIARIHPKPAENRLWRQGKLRRAAKAFLNEIGLRMGPRTRPKVGLRP